jgi:outer membrane protein assembly factor BamA
MVKDQILLKQAHFLSRGKFSEELLNKTAANLESYWRNAGYADVRVTPRIVDREPNLYVTFEILEGERTIVDSFHTVGNQNQEVSKLFTQLTIKQGDVYSPYRATQDKNRIIAEYLNLGYLNATLQVEAKPISNDKHHVVVTYVIDEGPQVRVAQAIYIGQRRSRLGLLERAVDIRTEAEMSESKLLEGESNLYNLGVFDWANVAPRRLVTNQTAEDVLVRVHEAQRNSITYGVGFESTLRSGSLSTGTLVLPGLPTIGLPRNFAIIQKTVISPLGSISYSRLNMRGQAETLRRE